MSATEQVTENLLAHLYSSSPAYRERIIDLYFHPTLCTGTDPLLTVHSRSAMKSLFDLQLHRWLVSDLNVQMKRLTQYEDTLVIETRAASGESLKPCTVVEVDFNVRVTQYTLLGKVLRTVGLLPPVTYFGGRANGGAPLKSKFYWVDEDAVDVEQVLDDQRNQIAFMETFYQIDSWSLIMPFYLLFWLMFFTQLYVKFIYYGLLHVLKLVHAPAAWSKAFVHQLTFLQPVRVFPQSRAPEPPLSTLKTLLGYTVSVLSGRSPVIDVWASTSSIAANSPGPTALNKIRKSPKKRV